MADPAQNDEQQTCLLRRLHICDTNTIIPVRPLRTTCYCYAIELAESEKLPILAEGFRLNRSIAIRMIRAVREADNP
jgi:hypothetical protein